MRGSLLLLSIIPLVIADSLEERLFGPLYDDPRKVDVLASALILVGVAVAFFGARVYTLMSLVFGFVSFFHFGFYSLNSFLKDNPTLFGMCIGVGVIGGGLTFRFARVAKATVGLVSGALTGYLAYILCLRFIPSGSVIVLAVIVGVFGLVGAVLGVQATNKALTILTAFVGAFMVSFGIDLLTDHQLTIKNLEHNNLNALGYGLLAVWLVIGTIGTYYQFFSFSFCLRCCRKSKKSTKESDSEFNSLPLSPSTRLVSPLLASGGNSHILQHYNVQQAVGRCGISNTGNTCFVNSTVQALFSLDPLRKHLTDSTVAVPAPSSRFPRALGVSLESQRPTAELVGRVMRQLANAATSSITPSELKSLASKLGFGDGRQHDASEFLRSVINSMVEDPSESHAFKSIFEFETCGVVQCHKCGHESITRENTIDLSLEIATAKTAASGTATPLETLIGAYFAPTVLDGADKYQCDKCQELTVASRSTRLNSLPEALVLSLNRFRFSPQQGRKMKVLDPVLVPEHISIAQVEYTLSAVIVHSGPSADGGHYYAFTCLPSSGGKQWFRFDDRSVCEMSFTGVREACLGLPMDNPYILIYSRI